MTWAGGFTIDLTAPYKVKAGDRYVIEFDVFDMTDPAVGIRPAEDGDGNVHTALADGVITQVRIELR